MITIRRLKVGEFELYRQIRLASLRDAPFAFSSTYPSALLRSDESWRKQADDSAEGSDRATFLVFSDADPVGLAALYRSESNPKAGEMIQVWISQEHRGTQVGRELLEKILQWAGANDFREIEARIIRGNDRALRFYQKNGFEVVRTEKRDGIEEYVAVRMINSSG